MSFTGDKREVLNLINTYDVLGELPDISRLRDDAINSVKSKSKNLLPYMLDLLKLLSPPKNYFKEKLNLGNGNDFNNNLNSFLNNESNGNRFNLETIIPQSGPIGELLDEILGDTDRLNRVLKEGLVLGIKSGFVCGVDFKIPSPSPEITVGLNKIDYTKLLTIDRNGIGGMYFGPSSRDFNTFLYDTVKNKETDNIWLDINGEPVIEVSYTLENGESKIKLKIPDSRVDTNFFDWLNDYINSTEILNYKSLITEISEFKSGIVSNLNNIGSDIILDKLLFDSSIGKIYDTGGEEIISVQSQDDSFFEFSNEELSFMESRSVDLSRGVTTIDLGCGLVEVPFDVNDLTPILNLGDDVTPQKRNEVVNNTITSLATTSSSLANPNDVSSGVNNYLDSLIIDLPKIINRFIITPKVVGIIQLVSKTINNKVIEVTSSYDFSKALKTFVRYVSLRILGIIIEFLFNKIKELIIKKIRDIVLTIIKEKLTTYINSIKGTIQSRTSTLSSGLESNLTDLGKSIWK